nr:hypothetical protein [Bacilli bacterium]
MVTKKYLNSFIKDFEACKDSDADWNAKLFEKCDSASWSETLISRSSHLRKNFEENEKRISELELAIKGPLKDKEYKNIADAAMKIYQDGYDDIRVFDLMLSPCIEHFKETKDLEYLIPAIHAYCFEYEQVDYELSVTPKYRYSDILVYKDEYPNLTSRYSRLTILKAASNVIARILYSEAPNSFLNMYHLYLEMKALWEKEEVQKLDGEDEEFLYYMDRMLQPLSLYGNLDSLNEEEWAIYQRIIEEQLKHEDSEYYPLILSLSEIVKNHNHLISDGECADYLIHRFDETFQKISEENDDNGLQDYL